MKPIKFEYKISFIYLVVGAGWIIFSDKILTNLAQNDDTEVYIQSIKGVFYVVITTLLLFFLLKSYAKRNREISEKLSDSIEKYKALYENAPLAYQSLDIDGCFIDINPQWLNLLGYEREDVIGKWFGDFLHPDYIEHFKLNFPRFKKQGYIKDVHFRMKKKDGSFIHVLYEGCIGYSPVGDFRQTYCTFKDITKEFETNKALSDSQIKYKALFDENVSVMLLIDSETGKILDANKSAISFYGYTIEQLQSKRIQDINTLSEDDVNDQMLKVKANKRNHFQFKHKLASGEIRDVDVHATTIKLENKTLLYSIIFDITDQLRTEYELLKVQKAIIESEEKFRAAFYTSPDSININTMQGYYVDVNQGFMDLTGYTKEEVIGKKSSAINIWNDPKDRKTLVKALEKDGKIENLEAAFKMKDGSLKTALMSATIIQLNSKPHILSVTRDITRRKLMEIELVKAKEQAEESDRLKSAFMANMSHEIRTPLNGVLGFANLLSDENIPAKTVKRYADIINKSGNRLLELINNILDISKIESGNMSVEIEPFSPSIVVEEVIDLFQANADKKKLKIKRTYPDAEITVYSDQSKVIQILSNLLNNAIKFTKKGYIEVGFHVNTNYITFHVKDTGTGVSKETIPHLFNRFYQGNTSLARGHEGSGLGLSLCKSLVELLEGEIWIESENKVGSTFQFKLPLTHS
ncbi:PAS domain-containing sensor histidine kinase [Sunxiuqinia sp. A32]|uniref:PAS domain-containing sensor histidine kinase n=1 Tax=Sunxiuqinia sp. A32 TaxID=3461496 RepID=UPI0040458BC1